MPTGEPSGEPLLGVRDLSVTYNRLIRGVQGVDLEVRSGEVVALLGSNGAGKTTTLRSISGFMKSENAQVTRGEITFRGSSMVGLRPHVIARRGISLVPERDKIFRSLTVEQNLRSLVASRAGAHDFTTDDVFELFPVLGQRRKQVSGYLSGGERQMLAIALAMMCRPTLLLVDELSLGISPLLLSRLLETIRRVNAEHGTTVLLVEQNARAAMGIADRAYIMENGRVVLSGTSAELQARPDVRELYLGLNRDSAHLGYTETPRRRRMKASYG